MRLISFKDKRLQQKAGWILLISLLIVILGVMSYLILITQRDIATTAQQEASSALPLPTTAEEALIASGLDGDLEIEEALNDGSIITLDSVIDTEDFGVATRSFENNVFTLDIIIMSPEPMKGKFYEGWLVGSRVVSTGALVKDTLEEGVYSVIFTSDEDLSDLSKVIVTEETLIYGLDNVPEKHILEGKF